MLHLSDLSVTGHTFFFEKLNPLNPYRGSPERLSAKDKTLLNPLHPLLGDLATSGRCPFGTGAIKHPFTKDLSVLSVAGPAGECF